METLLEYIPELIWWWPAELEMAGDIFASEEEPNYDDGHDLFALALRSTRRPAPPAFFLCPGERAPWIRCVSLKGSERDH